MRQRGNTRRHFYWQSDTTAAMSSGLAWGKAAVYTNGEAKRIAGCDQQPR